MRQACCRRHGRGRIRLMLCEAYQRPSRRSRFPCRIAQQRPGLHLPDGRRHREQLCHSPAIRMGLGKIRCPEVSLWHGFDGREFGYDDAVRLENQAHFRQGRGFHHHSWACPRSGTTSRPGMSSGVPFPRRTSTRRSTSSASSRRAENTDNLTAIHDLIRRHRPDARIVITLSPIPLLATFRPIPSMVANSVSMPISEARWMR